MKRLGLIAIPIALVGASIGCSGSHTSGDDDGGTIMIPDGAIPPDSGPPPDVCGDGHLDVGEMCDDGNTTPGDGCDATCAREAYCGDGTTTAPEVCDDENNRSGDGCRSDCMSDESCGNGIIDYAAGEICDGSDNCDSTCYAVTGCGDGTVTAPEVCDDANMSSFDGCDAACQNEITLVVDSLGLGTRTEACDLNGDGNVDNAFARALGILGSALGPLISNAIDSGNLIMLMDFLGLDDPTATTDDDLRVAWLRGMDADGDPSNNLSGSGTFSVDPGSLDPDDGAPTTSIQSQVASHMLTGGPEDIPLPLPIPIELQQGHVQGTTVADSGRLYEIQDGLLCGGVPVSLLALFGGFLGGGGGGSLMTAPPCDGGDPATIVDLIVGGGRATAMFGDRSFPLTFSATAPDLDLDADGLEGFEVLDTGADGCQPVVVACVDGDGTRIEGRNCYSDAAIADGYSAAFTFTAIQATLAPAPAGP